MSVQQNNLKTVKMVVLISFHFWRENNQFFFNIFYSFQGKNIFFTFLKKMTAKRQDTRMGLQSGWTEVTDPHW
jgi:hypothetical protein